jgi:hypothetical protein
VSEREQAVLDAMSRLGRDGRLPATPNEIGYACGFLPAPSKGGIGGGRGSGAGTSVSQRVNSTLRSLQRRGLIYSTVRRDGLSGGAYDLR